MRWILSFLLVGALSCSRCSQKPETPVSVPVKQQFTTFPTLTGQETLSPEQWVEFSKMANEEICPCGCPVSFAACLQSAELCKPAVLLGQWILDRLKQGVPMDLMAPGISQEINAGFSARPQIIDLDGYSSKGAKTPEMTLVEYADFECLHCKQSSVLVEEFVKKHPEIKFIFKHLPLESAHPTAKQAAIAAEAASQQGKFWPMHRALFASTQVLEPQQIEKIAHKTGLNMSQFKKDLDSSTVLARVENSQKEAELLGIQGTPAMFFNGRPYFLSTDGLGLELRLAMEKARSEARCH